MGKLLQGCVGLVTPDALDVLSHAAVRARNCSVLLATCSDAAALQGLRALAGRSVELSISQVGRRRSTWHMLASPPCLLPVIFVRMLCSRCRGLDASERASTGTYHLTAQEAVLALCMLARA